jgi:cytochrome c oxidase subunit IV
LKERIVPRRTYLLVCGLLLVLTASTVGLAYLDLGGWSLALALAFAATKATLIVLYFMEARYSRGLVRLVAAVALFWLGILLVGTLDDVITRGWMAVPGK